MPEKTDVPPPPELPDAMECCGTGCVPCIFDYYFEALEKWESQYGPLRNYQEQINSASTHD